MADGSVAVVGWLKTHVDGRAGKELAGDVKDVRKENVGLTVPARRIGNGFRYDALGHVQPFKGFKATRETVSIGNLPLAGGEIVILKFSK
jgi:hypothetical protein